MAVNATATTRRAPLTLRQQSAIIRWTAEKAARNLRPRPLNDTDEDFAEIYYERMCRWNGEDN